MTNQQKFDRLRKLLDEASVYARAVGKLDFDMQCCAPKDGMEQAGADMAVLSDRHFRLTHTKRYAQLVTELHADSEGLTPVQKKVVEHLYEAWEKEKNIPAKLNYEMSLAYNRAYSKWLEAKQAADFSLFRGGDPTPQNANSRLVLVGVKHGSNAAILVGRMLGLKNLDDFTPAEAEPGAPSWAAQRFHDGNGKLWRKLSVRDLLGDENFMNVGV